MKSRTGRGAAAIVFFLLAALPIIGAERRAVAAEAASLIDKTWTWGYVIQGPLPGKVPFISATGSPPFDGVSSCSLLFGTQTVRK